eukprot:CAMPEP_0170538004 /NCGR_PEP_ID=MMETSP0209-20121228/103052_1 /TAXON_ID=665100 ORGANISM="Litonotus pictus, Strain P1" /NCGR_SAMPLE_ID=MMETSP0209 /ASSEMBLY_ACC=CAM_ASM_000301 /LENGTH=434 /DNA_ID=CAMNT_0010839613 /DNA_START=489 /DNA_END=1794 /DNA_ORIENTATION=+
MTGLILLFGAFIILVFFYKIIQYLGKDRTRNGGRRAEARTDTDAPFQSKKASKKNTPHTLACSLCSVDLSEHQLQKQASAKEEKEIKANRSNKSIGSLKSMGENIKKSEIPKNNVINNYIDNIPRQKRSSCTVVQVEEMKELNVSKFQNVNSERNPSPESKEDKDKLEVQNKEEKELKDPKIRTARADIRNIHVANTASSLPQVKRWSKSGPSFCEKDNLNCEIMEGKDLVIIESEGVQDEKITQKENEPDKKAEQENVKTNGTERNKYYYKLYCGGFACDSCSPEFERKLSEGVYCKCAFCEEYIVGFKDEEKEILEQISIDDSNIYSSIRVEKIEYHNNQHNYSVALEVKENPFNDLKNNPDQNTEKGAPLLTDLRAEALLVYLKEKGTLMQRNTIQGRKSVTSAFSLTLPVFFPVRMPLSTKSINPALLCS